jgi:putative transposase
MGRTSWHCAPVHSAGQAAAERAYIERYNRTVRHEWLNQYMFATIKEVQDYATN